MGALPDFFDQIVPLLRGQRSSAELVARLGPTPSGVARLDFYRTLMQRNVSHGLQQLFPATRRAALSEPRRWERWVEAFDREHTLEHWEPNALGRDFPDFLGALAARGEAPPHAEQLADFEWLCHVVTYAQSDDGVPRLGSTLHAREYDFRVPEFVLDTQLTEPRPGTTRLLLYRDRCTLRARYHETNVLELAAVARSAAPAGALPRALPENEIERAGRELAARGIL